MATNEQAKPWVAEGISRRVWYHRRAQSRVPPATIASGNGQGKTRLLTRAALDGRTKARKAFDLIAQGIAEDLGGEDRLSTVQKHLVEAFAGAALHVNHLNARLLLGQEVDITAHASAISTMVRIASRIGVHRVARDVTPPDPLQYAREASEACGMNILQALDDPNVFGPFFRGPTWVVWRVFLCALFALPMTPEQLALFQRHTGRSTPPTQPLHEAWLVCGRRAGKSFILACVAIFLAAFKDWRPFLAPGEVGTIMIIAADRRQARVIMRYCLGLLKSVPMLAQLIESETRESVSLRNSIVVEVHTASHRATRGYAILCACLDECGSFPTDEASAEPDVEIINAIKPGMATIPAAILLCASSPMARKGALWSAYSKHYGKDNDPVLVWQAATRDMNATVPQSYIDAHMEEDPARASAEYLAQFRSDLEAYVSREVVETCVGDYYELSPEAGRSYYGFVDPAGGSGGGSGGGDSFALAIAHRDGNSVIVDLVRERRPPFMPSQVIDELIPLLKCFRISKVVGDRWGGGFPPEAFQKGGIRYEPSKQVKSDFYRDALAMLNSGRITLPKNDRLFNQLVSLERHVARGGHDVIDHPRDGHDDLANAAMAVAVLAGTFGGYTLELLGRATQWGDEPDAKPSYFQERAERQRRELLERYGRPVSLSPVPREHVEQAKAVEMLPAPVREGLERARLDARRRNGGEG